jgi:hypothetical protein
MSDGIYILASLEGYRVTYSKRYDDFMTLEGKLVGNVIEECFCSCQKCDTMEIAMDVAHRISKKYHETDDGICLISTGKNMSFERIVKG